MILDLIQAGTAALGFIVPPVFDFIKKKFISPKKETPEATLNNLATTKPEIIPAYIEALCKLFVAKKDFFNRDIVGEVSLWTRDLRAAIRPAFVIFTLVYWFVAPPLHWITPTYIQEIMILNCTSWFGSRLQ